MNLGRNLRAAGEGVKTEGIVRVISSTTSTGSRVAD